MRRQVSLTALFCRVSCDLGLTNVTSLAELSVVDARYKRGVCSWFSGICPRLSVWSFYRLKKRSVSDCVL